MKKLLITGGSGFVGGNLVQLAKNRFEVHATFFRNDIPIDNVVKHRVDNYLKNSGEELFEKVKPDIIIHTAALSNPDFCETHPEFTNRINRDFTRELCQVAKKNGARFIFTSTDLVFDGTRGNYFESDPVNPINYYAQSKAEAEREIMGMNGNYVIARVALVYGISLTDNHTFFERMLNQLQAGGEITLFDDQFRSPILVNNLAEALLELAEHDFTGIIHLSGGERISRWEFGLRMCKVFNLPEEKLIKKSMFDISTVAKRPQDASLQNTLAKQLLKTPLLDCYQGLLRLKD